MNANRSTLAVIVTVLLIGLVAPLAQASTVPATNTVTLAWDPCPDPAVTGYRLYWGGASQNYTNSISTGLKTSGTISNLTAGATYYFAVTSHTANGLESAFSSEISYTVPLSAVPPVALRLSLLPGKQISLNATGTAGYVYDVLTSSNGVSWTKVGSTTVATNGALQFTATGATNRAGFYRLKQTSP